MDHRAVEVSHPSLLPPVSEGGEWIEVPSLPASKWMAVQGPNGPEITPFVRDPEIELHIRKRTKWEQVKAIRDRRLSVAPTTYGNFDIDPTGKSNITGQIAALDSMVELGVPEPDTVQWRLSTNDFVSLTPAQLREVGVLIVQYVGLVYAASWQLEFAINSAENVSELETVDIESGWPE